MIRIQQAPQAPTRAPTAELPVPPAPRSFPQVIVQGPTPPPWVTMPPAVTLLIALGFFAACAVVLRPLFSAIGRRIEGHGRELSPALRGELDQLRHRLEDLEAVPGRVLELEERLDFAERLLAQRRDAERLERGAP